MQYGRFEIRQKLTSGGMAEIFLASQAMVSGASRIVVLKRIRPEHAENPVFVESFLREVRLCAQLTHPNIAQVYDAGTQGGEYYIAMEYVRGIDLARLLQTMRARNEQLPVEVALTIFCDVCEGLDFAHRAKNDAGEPLAIVHRDVTPSNVLLSFDGVAKVADFGIAKTSQPAEHRTATGTVKGKYGYVAPEQLDGKPIDKRVDVFTAGIVLHEMLTNTHPFKRDSEFSTLQSIRQDVVPPLEARVHPPLREALGRLVAGMLEKDPTKRTPSLRQARAEAQAIAVEHRLSLSHASVEEHLASLPQIDEAAAPTPGAARAPTLTAAADPPDARAHAAQSRARPSAILATLALALVAGLLFWLGQEQPSAHEEQTGAASLLIESTPSGAAVLIDGVLLSGNTPLEVSTLARGSTHEVRLLLDDHFEETRPITLAKDPARVAVVMSRKPQETKPNQRRLPLQPTVPITTAEVGASGKLLFRLVSPEGSWASIFVDGRLVGDTPLPPVELTAGSHELVFANDELGKRISRRIEVKAGKTETVLIKLLD